MRFMKDAFLEWLNMPVNNLEDLCTFICQAYGLFIVTTIYLFMLPLLLLLLSIMTGLTLYLLFTRRKSEWQTLGELGQLLAKELARAF